MFNKDSKERYTDIQNPFALVDGKIIHITEVDDEFRKAHKFFCPDSSCKSILLAALCTEKRSHFRHKLATQCKGLEAAVRLMAKRILEESLTVLLPKYERLPIVYDIHHRNHGGEIVLSPEKLIEADGVVGEVKIGTFQPDVVFKIDIRELLIAFKRRRKVNIYEENADLLASKNIIELDLSKFTVEDISSFENFKYFVLHGAPRKWIHYPAMDKLYHKNLEKLRQEVDLIDDQLREKDAADQREIDAKRNYIRPWIGKMIQHARSREWRAQNDEALRQEALNFDFVSAVLKIENETHKIKFIDQENKNDWVFKVHRTVWQAYILNTYAFSYQTITADDVFEQIKNKFGLIDQLEELLYYKQARLGYHDHEHGWGSPPDLDYHVLTDKQAHCIPDCADSIRKYLVYLYQNNIIDEYPLTLANMHMRHAGYKRKFASLKELSRQINQYYGKI